MTTSFRARALRGSGLRLRLGAAALALALAAAATVALSGAPALSAGAAAVLLAVVCACLLEAALSVTTIARVGDTIVIREGGLVRRRELRCACGQLQVLGEVRADDARGGVALEVALDGRPTHILRGHDHATVARAADHLSALCRS